MSGLKALASRAHAAPIRDRSLSYLLTENDCRREFFEEIIRDNLDLGRADRVQLL